jgi:NDP-sugar pyrophosphorylase family protein
MKVVIFAGGLGTRISEETDTRPKPMVEIGGKASSIIINNFLFTALTFSMK